MEIRKEKKDSALSLAIEGRIDTTTAPQLETELKADLDGVTELRLDFGQVEYISSADKKDYHLEGLQAQTLAPDSPDNNSEVLSSGAMYLLLYI